MKQHHWLFLAWGAQGAVRPLFWRYHAVSTISPVEDSASGFRNGSFQVGLRRDAIGWILILFSVCRTALYIYVCMYKVGQWVWKRVWMGFSAEDFFEILGYVLYSVYYLKVYQTGTDK